ncbi:MAG: IS1595 family transposase [Verrucomicrobiota bacterium]|jgi:transposase-like protein
METNLVKLIEDFRSEEQCRDYLEALRWPDGACCPRCQSKNISQIHERSQYDCNDCRHQFSVTAGSVFHDTHLPLWKWFLAVYIMCESKKSTSANQLKRTLGISYKTAWYLCHRIRKAMQDDIALNGVIEVDDAYVGGKRRGKVGRGATGKTGVVGMVERGGKVQLDTIARMDKESLTKFIESHLGKNVKMVITDSLSSYNKVGSIAPHKKVNKAQGEVTSEDNINAIENVWSLLKRSLIGSYHKVSAKHLPAYLSEIAFRFNNRENPNLFRDTMEKLLQGDHVTFEQLAA